MATMITARSESVLHYLNPIAMARNLWRHRDLIRQRAHHKQVALAEAVGLGTLHIQHADISIAKAQWYRQLG